MCSRAQLDVARSLHDDDLLGQWLERRPLANDLARRAARLIRKWVLVGDAKEDLWAKYNDVDRVVALLLTGAEGPKYVARPQCSGAITVGRGVFVDADFASCFMGAFLRSKSSINGARDSMITMLTARGCECPSLLPRWPEIYKRLAMLTFSSECAKTVLQNCANFATAEGEWRTLKHDGTYKVPMTVIGNAIGRRDQSKSAMRVCHIIRGESGAVPGLAMRASEGNQHALSAICEALNHEARASRRFIFSRTPQAPLLQPTLRSAGPRWRPSRVLRGLGRTPSI